MSQTQLASAASRPFTVSVDCHVVEPLDLWSTRIDHRFRDRLPRVQTIDGKKFMVVEGHKNQRIVDFTLEGDALERSQRGSHDIAERLRDHRRDGIDAEVTFPTRGLVCFVTPDPEFQMAQARVYNDWLHETYAGQFDWMMPAPCIPPLDVKSAIAEVERCAARGFRTFFLPAHIPQQPYNLAIYDPLWDAIQATGWPISFHVGTGRDPRTASGAGGAVYNYAVSALGGAQDTIARLISSGVAERFPNLKFGTIESGIGWVPWLLHALDEAQSKHHFWASPTLPMKCSEYYLRQGFAAFQDDPIGLAFIDRFERNFLWSNDYPHHEGTWPRSQPVIEQTMAHLTPAQRANVLGGNAARLFGFDPQRAARAMH
ncbi:MAG: amidohydrolase family protein [Gammaproteobacteria bacterium]